MAGEVVPRITATQPVVPVTPVRPNGAVLPADGQSAAAGATPGQGGSAPPPAGKTQAIGAAGSFSQQLNREIRFSVDPATGETVARVVDTTTNKVIRQIPSEVVLAIAQYLQGAKPGAIVDEHT